MLNMHAFYITYDVAVSAIYWEDNKGHGGQVVGHV